MEPGIMTISRPPLCQAVRQEDDGAHVCMRARGHAGAHVCTLDDHETPACGDGCCWDPCPIRWDNTPEAMRRATWTIDDAEVDDYISVPGWPEDRWLDVRYVGSSIIVGVDAKGRETAHRKTDHPFRLETRQP